MPLGAFALDIASTSMFVVTPNMLVSCSCFAKCVCDAKNDARREMGRRALEYVRQLMIEKIDKPLTLRLI